MLRFFRRLARQAPLVLLFIFCPIDALAPRIARCGTLPGEPIQEVILFDGRVGPGNPPVTELVVDGWRFSSGQFHTVSAPAAGLLVLVDSGSPYIASVGGGLDGPITLQRADGLPFSLVGFDGSEGFLDDLLSAEEGFASATSIEVEAMRTSGSTLTLEFDLDGLRDGPGLNADFQSFAMPDDLQSVTSVTFTGLVADRRDAGFALDNVVLAAVIPEPSGAMLALLAAAAGWIFTFRRSR